MHLACLFQKTKLKQLDFRGEQQRQTIRLNDVLTPLHSLPSLPLSELLAPTPLQSLLPVCIIKCENMQIEPNNASNATNNIRQWKGVLAGKAVWVYLPFR